MCSDFNKSCVISAVPRVIGINPHMLVPFELMLIPRIMCLTRVRALTNNINEMTAVLKELSMENQLKWTPQLEAMKENIELLVTDIKVVVLLSSRFVLKTIILFWPCCVKPK